MHERTPAMTLTLMAHRWPSVGLWLQVTQQLVTLLGNESDAVRARAATALKDMAASTSPETRMTVAMAGGIDRFVRLPHDKLTNPADEPC